jgi:hypothetical protein
LLTSRFYAVPLPCSTSTSELSRRRTSPSRLTSSSPLPVTTVCRAHSFPCPIHRPLTSSLELLCQTFTPTSPGSTPTSPAATSPSSSPPVLTPRYAFPCTFLLSVESSADVLSFLSLSSAVHPLEADRLLHPGNPHHQPGPEDHWFARLQAKRQQPARPRHRHRVRPPGR